MGPKERARLEQRITQLAGSAIQGSLVEVMIRCGKASCACHDDPSRRHGPHLYLKFRGANGRSTSRYIAREHEAELREAVAAWADMWQAMIELGQANREALVGRVRGKTRA